MTQEIIETGETPNDGTGDPLRTAFDKINNNFANLFTLTTGNPEILQLIDDTGNQSLGNSLNQINRMIVNLVSLAANSNVSNTTSTGNINTINNNINMTITNTFDSKANNPVIIRQKQKASKLATLSSIETTTSSLTIDPNAITFGNQEYINIGETPNDGNGDPLRVAFGKINNNFTNLFFTTSTSTTSYTSGITQNQVILQIPITRFYQAEFQIRSSDPGTADMQDITLTASITNNQTNVRFSGHSTLFEGNAICRYDMDVNNENVRILINPLVNEYLEHFISATVTYPISMTTPGIDIALDGYANGYLMGTEDNLILTTESE
jgi:CHASE3 domain sensor protein